MKHRICSLLKVYINGNSVQSKYLFLFDVAIVMYCGHWLNKHLSVKVQLFTDLWTSTVLQLT